MVDDLERYRVEQARYYPLVGELVSSFGLLDFYLFRAFKLLLRRDERICGTLYYRNSQFGARLSLVSAMMEECLVSAEDQARWASIAKAMREPHDVRNLVAHRFFSRQRYMIVGPEGHEGEEFMGAAPTSVEQKLDPKKSLWRREPTAKEPSADTARIAAAIETLKRIFTDLHQLLIDIEQSPAKVRDDRP